MSKTYESRSREWSAAEREAIRNEYVICAFSHPQRQRAGVYGPCGAGVAGEDGDVKTLYIEPGSPWENGYCESFNGKLRDELLDGEIFYTLGEAKVIIEAWRRIYNEVRPHSSLGYRPPAPEATIPSSASVASLLRPRMDSAHTLGLT